MKIVFVCTANICRSPMAEGMFRKMIEENGLEESVFCLSFGLAAKEGKRPPENAVAVCREIGVDISGHKARNLSSLKDLDIFDAFVVMTETQAYVLKQAGVPEDKLYLLG
ncbi:MAG: low molecular weight phosphatase family protein, partial [[Clostridium] leptum]